MSRSEQGRRRRRKPSPPPRVRAEHFKLLHEFGRNQTQKRATPPVREEMWKLVCQSARLPYVPHAETVDAWKAFIAGSSKHSRIAMNGDIEPGVVTVAIVYDRRYKAAHTTRVTKLLEKLLKLHRRTFRNDDAFLVDIEDTCRKIVGRAPITADEDTDELEEDDEP